MISHHIYFLQEHIEEIWERVSPPRHSELDSKENKKWVSYVVIEQVWQWSDRRFEPREAKPQKAIKNGQVVVVDELHICVLDSGGDFCDSGSWQFDLIRRTPISDPA